MAAELACDWHTVNDAVITYGEALLEADRKRLNKTTAIGLDETSFVNLGTKAQTDYATTVADVENHQIIDILPSRKFTDVAGWIDKQPQGWKERIRFGALDMSATYAAVYSVILPKAAQVVDPFHVISLANRCLDAVRRRVQTEQTGHRGRRDDPLYRARRVLLRGEETLDDGATERLWSLLELGDPGRRGGHRLSHQRTRARLLSNHGSRRGPPHARRAPAPLPEDAPCHPRSKGSGAPSRTGSTRSANYHLARVSNGPTEALNNLIKRIKRIGFGFRNFENYRIRALLYAGRPELAGAGLDRRPMRRATPPESEEPLWCPLASIWVSVHLQQRSDLHVCSRTVLGGGGNRTRVLRSRNRPSPSAADRDLSGAAPLPAAVSPRNQRRCPQRSVGESG